MASPWVACPPQLRSPRSAGVYGVPTRCLTQLISTAVLKQVVACFRTCLTQNGSQRGRAPAGQRPQPPSGGAWPRPATQHRPLHWQVRPLVAPVRESANGILVGNLRWPHSCEAISFPPSLSPAYSSAAVGVSSRLPLHAALLGSWITAGAWSLTGCRLLAFIFSTRTSRLARLLFRRPTR